MKQKRVFLLSGPSGSGKSTWVKNRVAQYGGKWISRDAIRFSMVSEDEEYFAHEGKVFNEFIRQCQEAIDNEEVSDVYIDATHLNTASRNKTMKRLNLEKVGMTICVRFKVPLVVCQYRNSLREGRANVPEAVIRDMYNRFNAPAVSEHFDEVWAINMEGERIVDLPDK